MIKMKVRGAEQVIAKLRSIGTRVPEGARKKMHASAQHIVDEARLNAPVEHGNLEAAIHIDRSYEAGTGRLKIDVVAGGIVGGRNVDDYAAVMHESDYELGPASQAKQQAHPERLIGPKFLERAAEAEQVPLIQQLVGVITRLSK